MSNEFKIWLLCATMLMLMLVLSGCAMNKPAHIAICSGLKQPINELSLALEHSTDDNAVLKGATVIDKYDEGCDK